MESRDERQWTASPCDSIVYFSAKNAFSGFGSWSYAGWSNSQPCLLLRLPLVVTFGGEAARTDITVSAFLSPTLPR